MAGGGAGVAPLRVCFFGTYARQYTVTRALMEAGHAAGLEVIECHEPLWEKRRTKDRRYFAAGNMAVMLARYLQCAIRLRRRLRTLAHVDCFIVGFQGQLDVLLLRSLSSTRHACIVFTPLVTLTETLVDDRRVYSAASFQARLAHRLDAVSLRAASRVVFDTVAHQTLVVRHFGLRESKSAVWYIGCDHQAFSPRAPRQPSDEMRVLFYGSFLPLHGTTTILDAAAQLARERIAVELIGEGPELGLATARLAEGMAHVRLLPWQPYEKLADHIAAADVCLGVFGSGTKAQAVIPNKVFQCAAVGRPVITADTPAVREVFTHGESIWLCPASNPGALADALRALRDDRELRLRLGRNAAQLMSDRFGPARQGDALRHILCEARGA